MKKHFLKFALLLASVGLMLASCERESSDLSLGADKGSFFSMDSDIWYDHFVYDTTKYCNSLSKLTAYATKFDSVYFLDPDTWGVGHKYKTIKFRKVGSSIIQEWLYEDLREDWFPHHYVEPDDPDGLNHGYYYSWENNFSNIPRNFFDDYVLDANGIPETGFHIASFTDQVNLTNIIGSSADIVEVLNVKSDGWFALPDFHRFVFYPCFWVSPYDSFFSNGEDPGRVEGCGIVLGWNPDCCYYYTNIRDLYTKVRLVRNISSSQW